MVRFRSHLMRPLEMSNPWNLAIVVLAGVAGAVGLYLTVAQDRGALLGVQAAGKAFLAWALCRELDPDRQWTAIALALIGAGWALVGMETAILPFGALLLIARVVVETTGRRPLVTDLAALVIYASLVSFTSLGWVMGFGIAVAIYVDNRMTEEPTRTALIAAMAAAVGSSIVASITRAFPQRLPTVLPWLVAVLGLLALVAVLREPVDPVSFVDSRNKRFLRRDRLHAGRAVAGILIFIGSLVAGETALAVVPMALIVAASIISTELERLQRKTPGSV